MSKRLGSGARARKPRSTTKPDAVRKTTAANTRRTVSNKIPRRVNILEQWWDVQQRPLGDSFGLTIPDKYQIVLDTRTGDEKLAETFLHELLHALLFTSGMHHEFDSEAHEERFVSRLSSTLFQVIRRNGLRLDKDFK